MTASRTDELLTILQDFYEVREEGWLWLALYDEDSEHGVVQEITGDYGEPISMSNLMAEAINRIEPVRAFLAVCRSDGRPTEADREFWRNIRRLVDASRLTDMVVFNRRTSWSMRAEDAAAGDYAGRTVARLRSGARARGVEGLGDDLPLAVDP